MKTYTTTTENPKGKHTAMKRILSLVLVLAASSQLAQAQQGFGTSNPAPSSVIDMTATNKGALLPRIALTSTTVAAPVNTPANALTVFNTATIGDVTPGYYYWSVPQMKWVRLLDATTPMGNNWRVELTTDPATSNIENIYQNGRVGIGNFAAIKPVASLDVRGAVRIGLPHASEVAGPIDGEDPVGQYTLGVGHQNRITGAGSLAVGYTNWVKTQNSFAVGESNEIFNSAERGYASGYLNKVRGQDAVAYGTANEANNVSEVVMGRYNAITTDINPTALGSNLPLFQVGNGSGAVRSNALTILQNGDVGIGIAGLNTAAKPTEKLDIGSGNVRIRDIATSDGSVADKVVVAYNNGVLATVSKASLAGTEPWQVQGFTTKATANGENIYQNAKVAIGNFSTGGAGGVSSKMLEVKGDFKAETTISGNKMGFEVNTPFGAQTTAAYWQSATNQTHAFVVDAASARAIAMDNLLAPTKVSNFEVGIDAVNIYSKHGGEAKQATLELNALNSQFALYANQVSANVGTMVKSDGANGLLMYHAGSVAGNNVNGVDRTQITVKKAEGVTFIHNDASAVLKGIYTFPTTNGTNGQVMTKSTGNNIVWATPVAAPRFFYAPSMIMPTTNTDLPSYVTYNAGTQTFTVDMYAVYSNQFGMTGDVAGATRTAIKSTGAGTLDVLGANALGYFVTYFDNTVYDPASIALSADGKLSYKVLSGATVSAKTYMNVVFKQL